MKQFDTITNSDVLSSQSWNTLSMPYDEESLPTRRRRSSIMRWGTWKDAFVSLTRLIMHLIGTLVLITFCSTIVVIILMLETVIVFNAIGIGLVWLYINISGWWF